MGIFFGDAVRTKSLLWANKRIHNRKSTLFSHYLESSVKIKR